MSTAVIVVVKEYLREAERQLIKTENYKKLPENAIAINMTLVNDKIERFEKTKINQ